MASKKKLRRNGIDNPGLRAQMDQSKIQAHNSMLTKAKLEAWLKSIVTYNAGDRDEGHYRDERRLDWDPANALVKKNVFEVSKEDRHYNNLNYLNFHRTNHSSSYHAEIVGTKCIISIKD